MVTYSQAREHAIKCGFVLGPVDAVPVQYIVSRSKSGLGAWLAVDVIDPETMDVVYPAGYWLDDADISRLNALGLDYVYVMLEA